MAPNMRLTCDSRCWGMDTVSTGLDGQEKATLLPIFRSLLMKQSTNLHSRSRIPLSGANSSPPQEDVMGFKLAHSQCTFITSTRPDTNSNITTSIPHTFVQTSEDGLPEAQMCRNMRRVLPELADRQFCYTRLCWDADTADRHFLVASHASYSGLFLAVGGHVALSFFQLSRST